MRSSFMDLSISKKEHSTAIWLTSILSPLKRKMLSTKLPSHLSKGLHAIQLAILMIALQAILCNKQLYLQ